MDRRAFLATSGTALTALAARWRSALGAPGAGLLPATGSRQVRRGLVTHVGQRLAHLRHLDGELGSGDLARLAQAELALIARLLRDGSYTAATAGRKYSLAAEAGRQAAWASFDLHEHAAASRLFETSLRASAAADDPFTGAYALSFPAVQC